MHRCSENVAAIATALAKAQTELSNPEKAMIGTVYDNRTDTQRNFRYASLSSGLDIVRKVLGGQQIAITQTTDIDRTSGTVNLTTLLVHTSGEWISSDWPVCQLTETAAPRRMGAALTYARRYALFTMVGIAGEDDLDAPDIGFETSKIVPRDRPTPASDQESISVGPNRHQSKTIVGQPAKLNLEESATTREKLIRKIQALPKEELNADAIAILKAKNCLSPADAKLVGQAFSARTDLLDDTPESSVSSSQFGAGLRSADPISLDKPARTGPKRKKSAANPPRVAQMENAASMEVIPSTSTHQEVDSTRIDKSKLTFGEPRRLRDKDHLKFVASQPCLVCGRSPADAHHLKFTQPRGMGLKVSDEFTVPLCRVHHRELHSFGSEISWWKGRSIDPLSISQALWNSTRAKT